jgi:hypothetical protein
VFVVVVVVRLSHLAAHKQIPHNATCNQADWPRKVVSSGFYNNFVEYNFTGKDAGLYRGVWLEYWIGHSGAAATDCTSWELRPKGRMGVFYSSPCWFVKGDNEIPIAGGELDQYGFCGMGGTGGWVFAFILDGNSTAQSFHVRQY